MREIYILFSSLFFISLLPAFTQEQVKLNIVYPGNNANINAPSTFFVGNTDPKAKLAINGENVKVYPNGGFVKVVKLKRGINKINIKSRLKNKERVLSYNIIVPEYEKTIPNSPLKIDKSSIVPDENLLYQQGDVVTVKFKGSTGNKATFSIGDKKDIPMVELPPKHSQTAIAFGQTSKTSAEPVKGIYSGSYVIQESDNFKDAPIEVKLFSDNQNITEPATAEITVLSKNELPIIAEVTKDNAVVRTAPSQGRLTPFNKGIRLNITGKMGANYRFKMGEAMEGWISGDDIKLLPAGTPVVKSIVSAINVESTSDIVLIKIPLSQKLPVYIEENPGPQMNLWIYGANSDVNLIPYNNSSDFIKEIKWSQPFKDSFKLIIVPNTNQFWGYSYSYDDNTLVLKLKKQPISDISNPLKDKIITIDPGHGGTESGSVGPTGIPEKDINLAIAKYLKQELESNGAKVELTRSDDETVGLYDRVKIAEDNDSQVLLSIHNNALPNGRDPYKEHGASVYYYQSQSLPLAKSIHNALVQNLGLSNYGMFWDSLALTRPSKPLAILIEVGFMINPDEYILLNNSNFQKKAARSISQGLEDFFKQTSN